MPQDIGWRGLFRRGHARRRRVSGGWRAFKEIGFIATGVGTHELYPNRDATKL
jgi:hypothetical protein